MKSLHMKDVKLIYHSPDCENVFLSDQRVEDQEQAFTDLANRLKLQGLNMDKTIVYCRTVMDCAAIFIYFLHVLGKHQCHCEMNSSEHRLFAVYHHSSLERIKKHVLESLMLADGIVRVLSRLLFSRKV